jgi:hypothetical protein
LIQANSVSVSDYPKPQQKENHSVHLSRVLKVRYLAVLLLVLIVAASAYAFAAANVVPESGAGDGEKAISGYTVTAVTYVLNSTTPANIDAVKFNIAPTAGASAPVTVKVQLVTSGTWFSCSVVTSPQWSFTTTGVTALAANNLRIVAAQ